MGNDTIYNGIIFNFYSFINWFPLRNLKRGAGCPRWQNPTCLSCLLSRDRSNSERCLGRSSPASVLRSRFSNRCKTAGRAPASSAPRKLFSRLFCSRSVLDYFLRSASCGVVRFPIFLSGACL